MKWAIRIVWGLNALLWPLAGWQTWKFLGTLDDPVEISYSMAKEASSSPLPTFPQPPDLGPRFVTFSLERDFSGVVYGPADNIIIRPQQYGHGAYYSHDLQNGGGE